MDPPEYRVQRIQTPDNSPYNPGLEFSNYRYIFLFMVFSKKKAERGVVYIQIISSGLELCGSRREG
jgi:hypothetical protein